jgi:hypothetical protein
LTNIPSHVPYLKTPQEYLERWRARVRAVSPDAGPKVGVVWMGTSQGVLPKTVRIPSAQLLSSLAQVNGVQFFSLQKGPGSDDPRPTGLNMIDLTKEINDFADTAALIELLDLVISIDTSVVHLAGALARPVWVLLPFSADFRWLTDRTDSLWYPTMRLFRSSSPQDNTDPIRRVVAALKEMRR